MRIVTSVASEEDRLNGSLAKATRTDHLEVSCFCLIVRCPVGSEH